MNIFCAQNQSAYTQINCGIDQAGIVAVGFIDEHAYSNPPRRRLTFRNRLVSIPIFSTRPSDPVCCNLNTRRISGGTPTEEDGFGKESTHHRRKAWGHYRIWGRKKTETLLRVSTPRSGNSFSFSNGGKGVYVDTRQLHTVSWLCLAVSPLARSGRWKLAGRTLLTRRRSTLLHQYLQNKGLN